MGTQRVGRKDLKSLLKKALDELEEISETPPSTPPERAAEEATVK